MQKNIIILITIAILIIIASFIVFQKNHIINKEDKINIGYIGPLTGSMAIAGLENLKGVELVVDRINNSGGIDGKKINLIIKDDQGKESESLTQYRQLVDIENTKYIFVSLYGSYLSLVKNAEKDGVILIESMDTSEELANLSKNTFAIGIYDESIGYTIADYFNEKNIKNIGIIYNLEDPFMLLVKNSLISRYKGTYKEESYAFSERDFRSTLLKLHDQEAIVLLGWEETGFIVRRAKELGIKSALVGIDIAAGDVFRKNTNNNYNGFIFSFWQGSGNNEEFKLMVEDYYSKFKKRPDNVLMLGTGYDSASILSYAIKGCDENIVCVADKIKGIDKFKGATGLITMDKDNITRSIFESLFTYENDSIVEMK